MSAYPSPPPAGTVVRRHPRRARPRAARGRRPPERAACACSPAPAPARPAPSPTASRTASTRGAYQPQRVLAVTFTARAAGEMRTRLRDLGVGGVQARTFHAAALRQLHYFWPQAIGGAAPEVLPHKAAVVAEAGVPAAAAVRPDRRPRPRRRGRVGQGQHAHPGDVCRGAPARAGRDPAGLDATADGAAVRGLRGGQDRARRHRLRGRAAADGRHPRRARGHRPRPCAASTATSSSTSTRTSTPLQQRLLDLWLGERDDVCVVGDPAQTIYSFTGASPRHLLGFPAGYPQAQVVRLVRNYRSTPQIVGLANLVVAGPRAATRGTRVQPAGAGRAPARSRS